MPVTANVETSKEKQPSLWGVGDLTQRLGVTPRKQPPMPLWELTWIETLITPFKFSSTTSALTEEITELFKQLMRLGIRVPASNDVWQYFEKHPHLIKATRDLAELACERLSDAILSLEISRDPEGDEEYVVLYARFYNYDETVMRKIRAARKEFLSLLSDEREWPLLTTDFRGPQEAE